MDKILIVEDDKEINRLIKDYFVSQNYKTISVYNGLDAMSYIQNQNDISIVLLDLMLPLKSGDRVLKEIREFTDIPVIIISAKDTVQNKIDVIKMGADDYITKPFDLDEIAVRIEAVLRRSGKSSIPKRILKFKEISLDSQNKTILVNGNILETTATEYAILEIMMQNPKKLFSKANLFESIWKEPYIGDESTVKVHISNLRNKIRVYSDHEYIQTVWGMGYKLNP